MPVPELNVPLLERCLPRLTTGLLVVPAQVTPPASVRSQAIVMVPGSGVLVPPPLSVR
ncbi:hypothetical protein D3C83_290540 [compost metagenome]